MNIDKLREYLDHKTWLGRRIFGNYYRERYGLKHQKFQDLTDEFDANSFVVSCNSEEDIQLFWLVAKEVDSQEEELVNAIEDLHFCRPIPWQYDFVEKVSALTGVNLLQTFGFGAVVDAYCTAKIYQLHLTELIDDLDSRYAIIFAKAKEKTNLLRRNFSLVLETVGSRYCYVNNANLNFRELVDRYVSKIGIRGLVEALKKARTDETRLTVGENAVMSMAYCSPFFLEETDGIAPHIPGRLLSACVADRLAQEQVYLENLHQQASHFGNDDDDDANDGIKSILEQTHCPIYLDPTEKCLIDVQRDSRPLYAHVYIEKFPKDDLNNSLPDFIQFKKGYLYTVEFVEDIKTLEVATELNRKLNAVKQELIRLGRACIENQRLIHDPQFQKRYHATERLLSSCFYVS